MVAGNLIPVLGVLLWGWRLSDLILLYWIENGVVGLYTIAKIVASRPAGVPRAKLIMGKVSGVPFFVLHYGLFWLIHGLFVVALFGGPGPTIPVQPHTFFFAAVIVTWLRADVYALPALGLLLSHGVSFLTNYLGRGEYRRLGPDELMLLPYGRVALLHLVVMAGGFLVLFLGQAQPVLLLFVAVKVAVDLRAHLVERQRTGEGEDVRGEAWG